MFNFIIYLYASLCLLAPHLLDAQEHITATKHTPAHKTENLFTKPITFTQPGLYYFITQVYNHIEYADFLAHNMHHITQFLKNIPTETCPILRMFGNKLKQTSYINPYAYTDLLDEITPLLKTSFTQDDSKSLKKQISKAMYDQMLYKFDYLKQDPSAYFTELTDNLMTLVHKHPTTQTQTLEINKTLVSFLELTLNKLVWHPSEYQHAWANVLRIADQLNQINEDVLRNHDDLNSLFITLLERFYLFLDLSYAEVPIDFYVGLRKQVTEQPILLFTLADQVVTFNGLCKTNTQFFQTKLQRFEKILTLAEAKARAYNEGIYAQHYIPPWK